MKMGMEKKSVKKVAKTGGALRLGLQMRDTITGFVGIATGKVEYLNGCVQFCLKAPMSADGKIEDGQWVDVGQLEVVGRGIFVTKKDVGGPASDTPSAAYLG